MNLTLCLSHKLCCTVAALVLSATTLSCLPALAEQETSNAVQMQQPRLPTQVQGEVVFIDNIEFPVPKPWTGNKVAVPPETTARLQLIPQDLTFNRTEIYLRNVSG